MTSPFSLSARAIPAARSLAATRSIVLTAVILAAGFAWLAREASAGEPANEPAKPAATAATNETKSDAVAADEAGTKKGESQGESGNNEKSQKKKQAKPKDPYAWQSMFDGKTLKGWKVPQFGGEGDVTVKDGAVVLGMGDPMTGITWKEELPKINYEFRMEARRTMGIDFFATTTFPYGDDPVSLVVGGWAGTVVGLSCIDWYDASDNLTTKFIAFKDKQWYRIRIRVTKQRIEAWIDGEKQVDLPTKGHKFTIRDEVDLCKPFGICTWCTEGQVRKMEIRQLKPEEVDEIPARDRWE